MTDSTKEELYKNPPTGLKNTTDYNFPTGWSEYTTQEKHRWFVRERVFRQAITQDTAFGRRYRSQVEEPHGVSLSKAWKRAKNGGFKR